MLYRRLDSVHLEYFSDRVRKVSEETRPRWGSMSPARIFRHLRLFLEVSLGEMEIPDRSNLLTRTVLFRLLLLMPRWPKGAPVPPRYIPTSQEDLETERAALLAAMRRFTERARSHPAERHVGEFFGPKPLRYWSLVHGRHFDHHLRQLGV